ncbi:MAG: DUF4145 domain-containing protein [Pseudomonadota bacterium]
MKYVPPALDQLAFNCPHCSALAKQMWFATHAEALRKDKTPLLLRPDRLKDLDFKTIEDPDQRRKFEAFAKRASEGSPFLDYNSQYINYDVHNLSISQCFNCDQIAVWIYDRLVWPPRGEASLPNPDLPLDIRQDYLEASTILNLSPRGAAALLRLAIQKMCIHLGEEGRNINADIGSLTKKGLDSRVQKALDVVRVVGNNAIHPGQIDLRDDHATAEKLFTLVNLIADIMISQPKQVTDMFEGLPEDARKAIEKRDG